MENKIYTEKRVNYDKLHSKLQIFRVKSVKNYIRQFFYTDTVCGVCDKYEVWPLVAGVVTNINSVSNVA